MPALTSAHESAAERSSGPVPGSPAAIGRGWLMALLCGCAGYAAAVAVFTSSGVQRDWAVVAAPSYAVAALAAAWRRRGTDAALLLSLSGGLLAPLLWLAAGNQAEREVGVIARSAWLLIHHGTPYPAAAALASTHSPDAYNPYLPAMTVFGLARAVAGNGLLTDPRIWFTAVFAAAFWLALRVTATPASGRWTALVLATPVIAFPLAVGGDDVPVLGLMCLGLALLAPREHQSVTPPERRERGPRPVLAGAVLGLAAAMKATAWPALLVAAVLVAARDGGRVTARFAAAALAVLAVAIGPVAAASPSALTDNTILFPLGLAHLRSGATSPLPGFLLASSGHAGHLVATGLLALAALGVAASLVLWPPRDVTAATWRLIIGLVLMFTLAPSTRFGYYLYPLGLWMWLRISCPAPAPALPAPGRSRLRRAADWVLVAGAGAGSGRIPLCG